MLACCVCLLVCVCVRVCTGKSDENGHNGDSEKPSTGSLLPDNLMDACVTLGATKCVKKFISDVYPRLTT